MGNAVGGELSTLANLHSSLSSHQGQALDFKTTLDNAVNNAVWTGTNAEKFRAAWAEFRPTFDKLSTALGEGATDVRNQHNNLAAATGEGARI